MRAIQFSIIVALLTTAAHAQSLPQPLVRLADIDPTIRQDIRYAGSDNFTGAPVPGYLEPACILTRRTAEALARVQRDLTPRGLSLKVYDCYRPVRAVEAFVDWVDSPDTAEATRRFHPNIPRATLVEAGYISARSGHSRGNVVDLTLVAIGGSGTPSAVDATKTYGTCTAPVAARAPDDSVDMGTGYDCLDEKSHVDARDLTTDQRRLRRTLTDAMARHGFRGYAKEWWHFSHPASDPGRAFDVPVTAGR